MSVWVFIITEDTLNISLPQKVWTWPDSFFFITIICKKELIFNVTANLPSGSFYSVVS